jgi:spore maturation protein CgeB
VKLKILILNEGQEYGLGASYTRAFRELGHEVRLIDPLVELNKFMAWRFPPTRRAFERQIISVFNKQWLKHLVELPADLVWVGKGAWAVPWLWRQFKKQKPKTKLVCYNTDNPIVTYSRGGNRPWVTESIPCFDLYCTYNKSLVEPLRRGGARQVARIPFAWDAWLHPEVEISDADRRRYECDVMFIGNGDPHRERWMRDIMAAAKPYHWRFAIYGCWNGCRDRSVSSVVRGEQIYCSGMAKAVRAAKISLNILRLQNEGSHNMRTFEIPGCSGVMVSQKSPEQEEFFPEGQAAFYFSNAEECVTKMRRLLENDFLLQQVREVAHELARKHTYVHRAQQVCNDAL